jgi:hypothetical protein
MPIQVLDKDEHSRLLSNLEEMLHIAGIQEKFFRSSMKEYCGQKEVDWVTNYRQYVKNGVPGLVLENISNPDSRCQAITGALLRNYIDARVYPLNHLLDLQQLRDTPDPSVLVVPNLFIKMSDKGIPVWKMQSMYDLLLNRAVHNRSSVVYIEDKKEMQKIYGTPIINFLENFTWVKE